VGEKKEVGMQGNEETAMEENEKPGTEANEEIRQGTVVPWNLVPDEEKNITRCNCPGCPSSPDDDTTLYCARGLSPVRVRTVGCLCASCPVYRVYELQDGYFCAVEPARWNNLRRP
jgi:hypothetical protein